jgi:hypothetical protein
MVERLKLISRNKGESLIYVLGVMMFLVIVCFSVTAAAVNSIRYVSSQKEYNDIMVVDNSIHKSMMYSLQSNNMNHLGRRIGLTLATNPGTFQPSVTYNAGVIDFPGRADFNIEVSLMFTNDPNPAIFNAIPAEYITERRWIRCSRIDYCSNSCQRARQGCEASCCGPLTAAQECDLQCSKDEHIHDGISCDDPDPVYCSIPEHTCDYDNPAACTLKCENAAHNHACGSACGAQPHVVCACGAGTDGTGKSLCTVEPRERRERIETDEAFMAHRVPRTATILAEMDVIVRITAADGSVHSTRASYEFSGATLTDCMDIHGECPSVSGAKCAVGCGGTCAVPNNLQCCMRKGGFENTLKFEPGEYGTWRLSRYEKIG